tara:strand:+ start:705 stop:1058 length:354 start_codon:yes stop_codon:yes gene_type:complete
MKITIKIYILAILISSNYLISEENRNDSDMDFEQVVCNIPGVKTKRNEEGFLDRLNTNIRREGCIKGDILVIEGSANTGLVVAYVCNITKDIIVFTSGEVLCTYQGYLSTFRKRIHF